MLNLHSPPLFFDADDHHLVDMVEGLLARKRGPRRARQLFNPDLHPRGIKELAAPKSFRVACAMVDLLGTLEEGSPTERIAALRAVRDEVLHETSHNLRNNVARVLLQIMKDLVRARGDQKKQLMLAHDFRRASLGKPRLVRDLLNKYHLLEMPEDWNQLSFDHHIHDMSTKGRKSPTHLVLDAWIKGIRFIGVVYYDHIQPDVAAELLEAAEIMDVDARIGIEFNVSIRSKYAKIVWTPRGFSSRDDFIDFIRQDKVNQFMDAGREVSEYRQQHTLQLLNSFNHNYLNKITRSLRLDDFQLEEEEFLLFVGVGQASLVHLAEFVHASLSERLAPHVEELQSAAREGDEGASAALQLAAELSPEVIIERYLTPSKNPGVPDLSVPSDDSALPERLRLDLEGLLAQIECLSSGYRLTLNPSNLLPAEVIELLYRAEGAITHIEIFNLKDWTLGSTTHRVAINQFRLLINSGNVLRLKHFISDILSEIEEIEPNSAQVQCFHEILANIQRFVGFYRARRLASRLGSDSIGRSQHVRGMGLVVLPTLSRRARREVLADPARVVPVATTVLRHATTMVNHAERDLEDPEGFDPLREQRGHCRVTWSQGHNSTRLTEHGNIASLGGLPEEHADGLYSALEPREDATSLPGVSELNTTFANVMKIIVGFVPAFLTFYLTKDWWLLAWFGAPIWFGVTGLRNILQSVVGGGGLARSSLLAWSDHVSWGRVADSLLFTGFSVPLLDLLVKDLFLARTLNITTVTSPIMLYTVIALANGVYISSHNTYRGLPLGAIVGNFFRTILSIPVAVGMSALTLQILLAFGVEVGSAQAGLQLWAAVISKIASDLVAAIIEGTADRQHNLKHRDLDYSEKLSQVYEVFGQFALRFPKEDIVALVRDNMSVPGDLAERCPELHRRMVINALDLLYFWMYQPRAQTALKALVQQMSDDERVILRASQEVLRDKRFVASLMLDSLISKRFEDPMTFYLSRCDRYLTELDGVFERAAALQSQAA